MFFLNNSTDNVLKSLIKMNNKIILFLNSISLLATILVNYLLNTGIANGNTMKSISDRYQNLFTPAGYAFSIWGIIYLFLIVYNIYSYYQLKKYRNDANLQSVGILFFATNIVNGLWVYFWLNYEIAVCLVLMVVLFILLMKIVLKNKFLQSKSSFVEKMCIKLPFDLYAGWVSVALIANTAAWLKKITWQPVILDEIGWAIGLLIIAGIIGIYVSWEHNAKAFGLAGAWGITAVAVSNFNENFNIVVAAVILSISLLSVSLYRLTNRMIPED